MKPDSALAKLLSNFGAKVGADTSGVEAEFTAFKVAAEAEKAELLATVQAALETVSKLESQLAEVTASLEEAKKAKADLEADIAAKAVAARKAKIAEAVGDAKLEEVYAAVEGLADAQFETVLSAMVAKTAIEGKSKMFTESGASGSTAAAPAISAEMRILMEKYAVKK